MLFFIQNEKLLLALLPGIGVGLTILSNWIFERQMNWRVFFIGHVLLITTILVSGCLMLELFGTEKMYQENTLDYYYFGRMLKYLAILGISLFLMKRYLWNKIDNRPTFFGMAIFMVIGVFSLIDLTLFIIKIRN